jgi:hypothetical protein
MKLTKNIVFIFLILANILISQDRYESFPNWIKGLPEYGFNGMKNSVTDKTNLFVIGGAGLGALFAYQYDSKVQDYSQREGLLPARVSQIGDLYGGVWSAWLLPVSVIITSKYSNDSNKEMLQKLDYTISALVANGVTTLVLKELIGRKRPNGNGTRSMPSGHTSHSFTVATIAHELYGNTVGIVAYFMAGLVAASRINDNKHYLSDVIIGAGLGTIIGTGFAKTYGEYKTEKSNGINFSISIPLD